MSKPKKIRKAVRKKVNRSMRRWQYALFLLMLSVGFLVSWMFPLRPTRSESEKRELSPFPKLTVQSLFSGSFFDGINLWFSDTFPFREAMVTANGKVKSLYGFGDRIYGLTDETGDAIPDAPVEPVTHALLDIDKADDEIDETIGGTIEVDDSLVQDLGTLMVVGDTGYEMYHFSQTLADKYIASVNNAAQKLDGVSHVYMIVVPTSIDITMPDNARAKTNCSSQADAIRYIYSGTVPQVTTVNIYNILRSHRTEYIYFRTDHHWTALGAYYAYTQYCHTIHTRPKALKAFKEHIYEGFKGSFVSESKKNAALDNNPDTVYAYEPDAQTTMVYTDKKGNQVDYDIISDVSTWNAASKYCTFIGGDYPYTIITNADVHKPKKCLVIKESFGNCFVPFLAADYSEVHVIDYRYWNGTIAEFAKEHEIDDVIFINNMSATRNKYLMNHLQTVTS